MVNQEYSRMADDINLPHAVSEWAAQWIASQNGGNAPSSITKLAGDGSQRHFYRIAAQPTPYLLLHDPDWIHSRDYAPHQSFLKDRGLPVPEFFCWDESLGCLLMEDLGDTLLQAHIHSNPEEKIPALKEATELLAKLHSATFPVPEDVPAFSRSFDADKYEQELHFTVTHLKEGSLKESSPDEKGRKDIRKFCEGISQIGPQVFSHRDYHTRNIMRKEGRLILIDFQDARLGSPHYDLSSLLYDAYLPIPSTERKNLCQVYRENLSKELSDLISWDTFEQDLKRVALQRTLKAAGSFASFFTRFGKKTHLPYLAPCLTMVDDLLRGLNESDLETIFPASSWLKKVGHIGKN